MSALRHRGDHKVFAVNSKVQYDDCIKKEVPRLCIILCTDVIPYRYYHVWSI